MCDASVIQLKQQQRAVWAQSCPHSRPLLVLLHVGRPAMLRPPLHRSPPDVDMSVPSCKGHSGAATAGVTATARARATRVIGIRLGRPSQPRPSMPAARGCCAGVVLLRRWWTGLGCGRAARGQLAAYLRAGWLTNNERQERTILLLAAAALTRLAALRGWLAAAVSSCSQQSVSSKQLLMGHSMLCDSRRPQTTDSLPAAVDKEF
eukprot:COSAG01_NODE_3042_length_6680_cov_3.284455_5_plen_206_part_00